MSGGFGGNFPPPPPPFFGAGAAPPTAAAPPTTAAPFFGGPAPATTPLFGSGAAGGGFGGGGGFASAATTSGPPSSYSSSLFGNPSQAMSATTGASPFGGGSFGQPPFAAPAGPASSSALPSPFGQPAPPPAAPIFGAPTTATTATGFGGSSGGGNTGFGGGGFGGNNTAMAFGSSTSVLAATPSAGGFGVGGGFGGSTTFGGGGFAAAAAAAAPMPSSSSPFGSSLLPQQQPQQSSSPSNTATFSGFMTSAAPMSSFPTMSSQPQLQLQAFSSSTATPNPNPFSAAASSSNPFAGGFGAPAGAATPFGGGALAPTPFGGGGGSGGAASFAPAVQASAFPVAPFPSSSTAAIGGFSTSSALNPSAPPFTPFGSSSTTVATTTTTPSASTFQSPFGGLGGGAWTTGPNQRDAGGDDDDSDMTMMMTTTQPQGASPFQRGASRPLHTPFPGASATSLSPVPEAEEGPTTGGFGGGAAAATFGATRSNTTGFGAPAPPPFGNSWPSTAPNEGSSGGGDDQKRLEALKAKLAEKKKRLLEKQREAQARGGASPPRTAASGDDDDDNDNYNQNNFGSAPSIPSQRSGFPSRHDVVARNELRFGSTNASSAASSSDRLTSRKPQSSSSNAAASTSQVAPTEREDLSSAVSLVGTCRFMCPEEELDRRQRESDIQLLEIPNPSIYPSHYTLRDTVVKRFRRSAADYKLDVPEWVRPADVLEVVCGYLEEWVMERDRQGPDPRFPQNSTPPSLDVYQFVWDRTRMIRKDFTLQNYVGTGGKCDARAVRCHERIARWHAMCEHQLSHIPDFVKAQSQQNIQELGQTMKTLNQYYDDSLSRATVEVPDDQGIETRHNLEDTSHGCTFDAIQGKNPVDYDGTVLDNEPNSASVQQRLVGQQSVNSPNHGTAEPEMRGLYILLTIDNDGGMEVLKYAAHLFQRRPLVYNSKPVQLALSIYKAKREHNYAKFFSLLRHRDTPYLFACIMFKHVELMRKNAFRIMSKTYGAKSKESNETINDAYPLRNLARLLCFETLDEARNACQHYSITVKPMKVRTSSGTSIEEIIFWRESTFLEPKDEDKGTLIPLPPQKMIRIIESKLRGATRLAVCRGQVSGPGACLSSHEAPTGTSVVASPSTNVSSLGDSELSSEHKSKQDAAFQAILKRQQELLQKQTAESERSKQAEAQLHEEENARRKKEEELELKKAEEASRKRDEELRRQHEEEVRLYREAEVKRLELLKARQLEQERIDREREMIERKAREEELRIEQLRMESELKRKKTESEQQELKRKAEEAARERQLEIERENRIRQMEREEEKRRRREEEARKEAKLAEERRKQQEDESRRRQALQRELEAKRLKEEEEERAWAVETEDARKSLLWGVWKSMYPPQPSKKQLSLESPVRASSQLALSLKRQAAETARRVTQPLSLLQVIRNLLKSGSFTSLALLVADLVSSPAYGGVESHPPILLNVAIFIPMPADSKFDICELVSAWISLRIGIGSVSSATGPGRTIRVAVVDCSGPTELDFVADVALVVMTPPWSDAAASSNAAQDYVRATTSRFDKGVPTVILSIREHPSSADVRLASEVASYYDKSLVVSHESVEEEVVEDAMQYVSQALAEALEDVVTSNDFVTMDRFSLTKLGFMALRSTLWRDPDLASDGRNSFIFHHAVLSFACCAEVLDEYSRNPLTSEEMTSPWPSRVFAARNGLVEDYFEAGIPLPVNWKALLREANVKPHLDDLCALLTGSLAEVINALLSDAPFNELQESDCFLEERRYKECLHHALLYCESQVQYDGPCVYLPHSMVHKLLDSTADRFEAILTSEREQQSSRMQSPAFRVAVDDDFIGPIDLPPDDEDRQDHSSFVESQKYASDRSKPSTDVLDDIATVAPSVDPMPTTTPVEEKPDDACLFQPVSSTTKRGRSASGAGSRPGSRPGGGGAASSAHRKRPRSVLESRKYTRWLRDLEQGDPIDMMVGNTPLSILLAEAPNLADDLAARSSLRSKKE